MKFENETKFVNEAAKEIVKEHLNWSNSLDSKPSDNHASRTYGKMHDAYFEHMYGEDWYENISNKQHEKDTEYLVDYFEDAKKRADKIWNTMLAVMDI